MKNKIKIVVSLVLTMVISVVGCLIPQNLAFAEQNFSVYNHDYPRSGINDSNYNKDCFNYQINLKLMNNWVLNVVYDQSLPIEERTKGILIHYASNNKVVYCIEPSQLFQSESMLTVSELQADKLTNNLSVEKTRELFGLILEYGYSDNIQFDWHTDKDDDLKKLARILATAVLIAEVVIGERDGNFNRVNTGNHDVAKQYITSKSNDLSTKALELYDEIERNVKSACNIPSFSKSNISEAPTYEMIYDEKTDLTSIVLENSSDISVSTKYEATLDGQKFEGLTLKSENNKLTISTTEKVEGTIELKFYCEGKIINPIILSDGKYSTVKDPNNKQDLVMPGDETNYYKEGYIKLKLPHIHSYAPAIVKPTCVQRGYTKWICRCGDSYVNNYTEPLGHSFILQSTVDATCTEDGYKNLVCERCKITRMEDGEKCSHGNKVWVTTLPATCKSEGEKTAFCSKCGNILDTQKIEKLEHNYVYTVINECSADNNGLADYICTQCGESQKKQSEIYLHTHKFGYSSVIKQPTCTNNGEKGTFCSICLACYKSETISAKGHSKKTVEVIKNEATCTQAGEKIIFCDDCGNIIDTKEITPLGHTANTVEYVTLKPTCTTDGEKIYSCTRCAKVVDKKVIDKTGHSKGIWLLSVPPTCTTKGEEKSVCDYCNVVISTREVKALGHDEGTWTEKHADCLNEGEKICTCTRCNKIIASQIIGSLGHDSGVWKIDFEATADHNGQMTRYCSKCNIALETKEFALHEHTFGYESIEIMPTCTTSGLTGKFCGKCGAEYESYQTDALGHDYGEISTNNNGTHSSACSRCHDVKINNCEYYETVIDATCTVGGRTVHTCKDCGFVFFDKFTAPLSHSFNFWQQSDNDKYHCRDCERCKDVEYQEHSFGKWHEDDTRTTCQKFTENVPLVRVCRDCNIEERSELLHTSILSKIFYPICTWIRNILSKLGFVISLDWLFPSLNIQ